VGPWTPGRPSQATLVLFRFGDRRGDCRGWHNFTTAWVASIWQSVQNGQFPKMTAAGSAAFATSRQKLANPRHHITRALCARSLLGPAARGVRAWPAIRQGSRASVDPFGTVVGFKSYGDLDTRSVSGRDIDPGPGAGSRPCPVAVHFLPDLEPSDQNIEN
jgi:hypothetical protein